MITSNDFRPGVTIEIDGQVWQVVEFQHVKPGKGAAFVRAKIKNLETNSDQKLTIPVFLLSKLASRTSSYSPLGTVKRR